MAMTHGGRLRIEITKWSFNLVASAMQSAKIRDCFVESSVWSSDTIFLIETPPRVRAQNFIEDSINELDSSLSLVR